jgi:hypothetical protein
MGAWMAYLHMQKPIPPNATGVPVKLTAVGPSNNPEDLGTVTSDMSGLFSQVWAPTVAGKYTIIATFEGSDSYDSSYAETVIVAATAAAPSVGPTQTPTTPSATPPTSPSVSTSPTVAPTPPGTVQTETVIIAAAAVVIILAVAAAAVYLRRRK